MDIREVIDFIIERLHITEDQAITIYNGVANNIRKATDYTIDDEKARILIIGTINDMLTGFAWEVE